MKRPISLVIRDAVAGIIDSFPNLFPFGRAWTEMWLQ